MHMQMHVRMHPLCGDQLRAALRDEKERGARAEPQRRTAGEGSAVLASDRECECKCAGLLPSTEFLHPSHIEQTRLGLAGVRRAGRSGRALDWLIVTLRACLLACLVAVCLRVRGLAGGP